MMELELKSEFESLEVAHDFIERIVERHACFRPIFANIYTVVSEAINNAIIHGNKLNREKLIHVQCKIGKNKIWFSVRDEGNGFDYTSIPDPTLPENIENVSGRGIFLIKQLSDELEFAEEGKELRITFYCPFIEEKSL